MRLLAILVAFVAVCFPALAQENKTVTIAVSGPPAQLYFLPVVLARQLGYFEQARVNVELQHFNRFVEAARNAVK